jgi:hypothetical protein
VKIRESAEKQTMTVQCFKRKTSRNQDAKDASFTDCTKIMKRKPFHME